MSKRTIHVVSRDIDYANFQPFAAFTDQEKALECERLAEEYGISIDVQEIEVDQNLSALKPCMPPASPFGWRVTFQLDDGRLLRSVVDFTGAEEPRASGEVLTVHVRAKSRSESVAAASVKRDAWVAYQKAIAAPRREDT